MLSCCRLVLATKLVSCNQNDMTYSSPQVGGSLFGCRSGLQRLKRRSVINSPSVKSSWFSSSSSTRSLDHKLLHQFYHFVVEFDLAVMALSRLVAKFQGSGLRSPSLQVVGRRLPNLTVVRLVLCGKTRLPKKWDTSGHIEQVLICFI